MKIENLTLVFLCFNVFMIPISPRQWQWFYGVITAVVLALLSLQLFFGQTKLKVIFLDVGQGDAALIRTPNGKNLLIDGGPKGDFLLHKLNQYLPFWDKTLDFILLSHPHLDHLGGLLEVVKKYEVSNVLETGTIAPSAHYQLWRQILKEKAINQVTVFPEQDLFLEENLWLDFLYPDRPVLQQPENETSMILKLVYGENRFLFTGDMETNEEIEILKTPTYLGAEFLKVGHHGSKTSSSVNFLTAVHPQFGLISAGKENKFGHPHAEILQRLEEKQIQIANTQTEGDVRWECDTTQCVRK